MKPASREAVIGLNHELQKHRALGALPDHSGHVAFQIPEADYNRLAYGELLRIDVAAGKAYVRKPQYPGLASSDRDVAKRELLRLLKDHPEYKINPNEGKKGLANRTRGVIVR